MLPALDAVHTCAEMDRAATTAVVIDMIDRKLKVGENVVAFAKLIPANLWSGALAERVLDLAKDTVLAPSIRAGFLEMLATCENTFALPLAAEWTENIPSGEHAAALYRVALNVRLSCSRRKHGHWLKPITSVVASTLSATYPHFGNATVTSGRTSRNGPRGN